MSQRDLDIIFCNLPLIGLLLALITWMTGLGLAEEPIGYTLGLIMIFGSVFGVAYGIYRVSQQKWASKKVVLWVFGLLFFSQFSLPWLYWGHLRNQVE